MTDKKSRWDLRISIVRLMETALPLNGHKREDELQGYKKKKWFRRLLKYACC